MTVVAGGQSSARRPSSRRSGSVPTLHRRRTLCQEEKASCPHLTEEGLEAQRGSLLRELGSEPCCLSSNMHICGFYAQAPTLGVGPRAGCPEMGYLGILIILKKSYLRASLGKITQTLLRARKAGN